MRETWVNLSRGGRWIFTLSVSGEEHAGQNTKNSVFMIYTGIDGTQSPNYEALLVEFTSTMNVGEKFQPSSSYCDRISTTATIRRDYSIRSSHQRRANSSVPLLHFLLLMLIGRMTPAILPVRKLYS
ncbi:hypothetical protein SCHPADRAFT_544019 [Schizopora paradoxa]|uniref:Uncharacterized protein n=1 Tax=Schizopora paradoxa TaxID=27342 RepID=A0A0H2REH0_9AGAM|nr:hypothetical protein SCHPADRAFT_544019 [Schizopora paradoxa]